MGFKRTEQHLANYRFFSASRIAERHFFTALFQLYSEVFFEMLFLRVEEPLRETSEINSGDEFMKPIHCGRRRGKELEGGGGVSWSSTMFLLCRTQQGFLKTLLFIHLPSCSPTTTADSVQEGKSKGGRAPLCSFTGGDHPSHPWSGQLGSKVLVGTQ